MRRTDALGKRFAFFCAFRAAVEGAVRAIRNGYEAIRAEGIAATIALELIAAGAEERSTFCAGCGFEEDVSAFFVIFNGGAVKGGFTVGAGRGIEVLSHGFNNSSALSYCQEKKSRTCENFRLALS